ncbi:MAG: branched-chain amino acid ABC transporter permease [Alphaproteobacteria bacterium]
MDMAVQILAAGVITGCIYALVALGFTIVYNAAGIVNFAHGEFIMMGGVVSAIVILRLGLNPLLAVPATMLLVGSVAVLMDQAILQRARRRSHITLVMLTIGAGIIFRGVVEFAIGKDVHFPTGLGLIPPLSVFGAHVSSQGVWIVAALLAVATGLWYLLRKTWLGRAMRATAENPRAATLMGISPRLISAVAFLIAGALGALAGALIAPLASASYDNGLFFGVKGFAAAILGGLGSPIGAILGGVLIGVIEAFSAGYIASAYKDAVALLLLIVMLLLRPSGLFGVPQVKRV